MILVEYIFEIWKQIFYYPLPLFDKILAAIELFLFSAGFSFAIVSLYVILRKLLEKYTTPFGKYGEGFFGWGTYMKIKDIGVAASFSAAVGVFILGGIENPLIITFIFYFFSILGVLALLILIRKLLNKKL